MLAMAGVMMVSSSPARAEGTRVVPAVYAAVQAQGAVRVMVRLGTDDTSAQAIAAAQNEVLAALRGTTHRILQRYAASPYLALEVGLDALNALDRAPKVLTVAPDFELR